MKIIHCADVHFGSRMGRLPKEKAEDRAREIRASFDRLIDYARQNGIKNILLAGDVFDSDRPFKKDKEFFYKTVKTNPDIDFYYLRGNHDGKESYTEQIENLKTFGEEWTGYMLGENVYLCGLEITSGNCGSMYSSLKLEANNHNIVMLHGAIEPSVGEGKINVTKFKNKNIDYLALGHYHSYCTDKIDTRGAWAYSGCLEGRGFDETGAKGFIVYDTDKKQAAFVPFAARTVEEINVDISGAADWLEALEKVKSAVSFNPKNLVRINLVGEVNFIDETLEKEIEKNLSDKFYLVSVKDGTRQKIDYKDYADSPTLKGEFIRLAFSEIADEDERQKILDVGLKALTGNL